ncbi:MAG: hypothetical protein PVG96_16715, partial [Desulfobacterales bacterium]
FENNLQAHDELFEFCTSPIESLTGVAKRHSTGRVGGFLTIIAIYEKRKKLSLSLFPSPFLQKY